MILEQKNGHPRDKHLEFDPEPHTYTVDGEGGYISVTGLVKEHFPDTFNKDWMISQMMMGKNWKKSEYYGMTREQIKQEWENRKVEGLTEGTKFHLDVEKYYNGMEVDNNSKEYK